MQLDDVSKRAKSVYQRVQVLLATIQLYQRMKFKSKKCKLSKFHIVRVLRRLINQQQAFSESLWKTTNICNEIAMGRKNHITAIEVTQNRKIFDSMNEYEAVVLESQGRDEYDKYILNIKNNCLGLIT
jgi:hypothetical protein